MRTRREALGFVATGAGALVLSGCTSGSVGDRVVLDSYYASGEGRQAMLDAVEATPAAVSTQIGTTSRATFMASIGGYLESRPGSVFTWSAGFRLNELISNGGLQELSSVWKAEDLNPRLRRLASDPSGVQYLVPLCFEPWAFFFSRPAWVDAGYSPPDSSAQLVALAEEMAANGTAAMGLSRLATPALLVLFDYVNMCVNGRDAHRQSIVQPSEADAGGRAETFDVFRSLAAVEAELAETAPVSIVPAALSEAGTRAGAGEGFGCFVLDPRWVVADVEGFLLANGPENQTSKPAVELVTHLASIEAQQAFVGDDTGKLTANLNANYQAMTPTMLKMVEIVDEASDIVESVRTAPAPVLEQITTELIAIVRP